jgi:hypothetical protein
VEIVMEREPTARLGKCVKDLDPDFVARYIAHQEAGWLLDKELAERIGE